jgi:hypothetical protein
MVKQNAVHRYHAGCSHDEHTKPVCSDKGTIVTPSSPLVPGRAGIHDRIKSTCSQLRQMAANITMAVLLA